MDPRLFAFVFAIILGALTSQVLFWRSVQAHLHDA